MNVSRDRRISARDAEHLLSGVRVDRHARVARVLRAAAAPGRPGELNGRQEALAAFRRGRVHTAPPRRQPTIKSVGLKLLTIKAAVVTALFVGAGGVAVAAGTGALPMPLRGVRTPTTSAEHPTSNHGVVASPHPSVTGSPGTSPSTSVIDLCHAYLEGNGSARGKILDSPEFRPLVVAAGGKQKVEGFCSKLAGGQSAHPKPGSSGHASGHPSHPNGHTTGAANGRRVGATAVRAASRKNSPAHSSH
jgi:hypothetical protein